MNNLLLCIFIIYKKYLMQRQTFPPYLFKRQLSITTSWKALLKTSNTSKKSPDFRCLLSFCKVHTTFFVFLLYRNPGVKIHKTKMDNQNSAPAWSLASVSPLPPSSHSFLHFPSVHCAKFRDFARLWRNTRLRLGRTYASAADRKIDNKSILNKCCWRMHNCQVKSQGKNNKPEKKKTIASPTDLEIKSHKWGW